MKIAIVQFSPKIGHVQANVETASRLCSKLTPQSVDLVCLPEMVFTGYVFPDADAITPFLEEPGKGPTSRFCAQLSARLHCYTMAGYPERLAPHELQENGSAEHKRPVGANSAVLFGPGGKFIGNYRKTNLFETDMSWAKAGTGFVTFDLPPPLSTVSLGICMDLNVQPPAMWMLEEGPYELAEYCLAKQSNTLIMLNAWLDSGENVEEEYDWATLNYWAARLRPLWHDGADEDAADSDSDMEDYLRGNGRVERPGTRETTVIICNRSGEENGKTFAGTSAAFSLKQGSGKPKLLHAMPRRGEGIRIWTV